MFPKYIKQHTFRRLIAVHNTSPGKFSGSPSDLAPSSLLSFSSLFYSVNLFYWVNLKLKLILFSHLSIVNSQECTAGERGGQRSISFQTCDWNFWFTNGLQISDFESTMCPTICKGRKNICNKLYQNAILQN